LKTKKTDCPSSKRQRSSLVKTAADEKPDAPSTNRAAFKIAEAATQKLAKLVENHPQFHLRMENMLEYIYKHLEPKVSTAISRQKNEESSVIYKLSNDELKLCFGYLGEYQYRYTAGHHIGSNKYTMTLSEIRNKPASIVLQWQCPVRNCIWQRLTGITRDCSPARRGMARWRFWNGHRILVTISI
jgi:hypothetical protein